ncbi:CLU domain containing protein like protein, partial [Aduncisulcus paluster]
MGISCTKAGEVYPPHKASKKEDSKTQEPKKTEELKKEPKEPQPVLPKEEPEKKVLEISKPKQDQQVRETTSQILIDLPKEPKKADIVVPKKEPEVVVPKKEPKIAIDLPKKEPKKPQPVLPKEEPEKKVLEVSNHKQDQQVRETTSQILIDLPKEPKKADIVVPKKEPKITIDRPKKEPKKPEVVPKKTPEVVIPKKEPKIAIDFVKQKHDELEMVLPHPSQDHERDRILKEMSAFASEFRYSEAREEYEHRLAVEEEARKRRLEKEHREAERREIHRKAEELDMRSLSDPSLLSLRVSFPPIPAAAMRRLIGAVISGDQEDLLADASDSVLDSSQAQPVVTPVFRYHLPMEHATCGVLKSEIMRSHGYGLDQMLLLAGNTLLNDGDSLARFAGFIDSEGSHIVPSCFRLVVSGSPSSAPTDPSFIPIPIISEYSLDELRGKALLRDGSDELLTETSTVVSTGASVETIAGPAGISGDIPLTTSSLIPKVPVSIQNIPIFRDWASQQQDVTTHMVSQSISALNAEKLFNSMRKDFEHTVKAAVQIVMEGKLRPVDLKGLYGIGGQTYVCGGIILRRVGGWVVDGVDIGDGDSAFKYAEMEAVAYKFMREKGAERGLDDALIPFSCLCDYCGQRFFCVAHLPIEAHHLYGGSIDDGLTLKGLFVDEQLQAHIEDTDEPRFTTLTNSYDVCAHIGKAMNVATHRAVPALAEHVSKTRLGKRMLKGEEMQSVWLPLDIHTKVFQQTAAPDCFYVLPSAHCLPRDMSEAMDGSLDELEGRNIEDEELLIRSTAFRLRPELVASYSCGGILKPGFTEYHTVPSRLCDHCKTIINEYSYYSYVNPAGSIVKKQY